MENGESMGGNELPVATSLSTCDRDHGGGYYDQVNERARMRLLRVPVEP